MVSHQVTVRAGGVVLDTCRIAVPLTIVHGRSGVGTQPDPPTCTLTWIGSDPPGQLGDLLEIDADSQFTPATYDDPVVTYDDPSAVYDTVATPRFRGIIAGITANEVDGQVASWEVDGVGHLAQLGFIQVTITRPQETDAVRVAAIAAAAGVAVVVRGDPGPLLAADSIDQDTLGAIQQVAASSAGLLWQAPDGTLVYGTGKHRTGRQVGTLPCDIIGDGVAWDQQIEQVINHITVTWGPEDTQTQDTFHDPASMAMPWGLRHADVKTMCATQAAADQLAQLILHRNSFPYWSTPSAMLYGSQTSAVEGRMLALLDVSAGVLVPIPGAPGATPSALRPAIVEGWVETWDADDHLVQVALSDTARWVTTRLRTYAEVLAGGDYAYWKAYGTYMDMLIVEGVPT